MNRTKGRLMFISVLAGLMIILMGLLVGCDKKTEDVAEGSEVTETVTAVDEDTEAVTQANASEAQESDVEVVSNTSNIEIITSVANVTSDGAIDASDIFTTRDLEQNVDITNAEKYEVSDGEDISITSEGVYVISGSAKDVTITVEVGDEEKVQLVLDGVSISNEDFPCIYVKNADKVFVTTTESENTLEVIGTFVADGETNTDAVVFSKDDVILNGMGTLNINSTDNGVTVKDDVKVTGGTINISATSDAIEANESIAISDGTINIDTDKDGLHAENTDDYTTGFIYICGGTLSINAGDDGIQGTTVVQIDGGKIDIDAIEGIEGTYIQINDGEINIYASDDGINASYKSSAYTMACEINGGITTVEMAQGDTDAVDSNGYIYMNGGTLDLYAQSPFDFDMGAEYNGGTIMVNGTETNEIVNQMMGGGMGGMGFGGGAMGGGHMGGGPWG